MDKWRRRTLYYSVLLVAVMLGYAVLYRQGMRAYEGDPITLLHAIQVVVETFTTTGYGSDSPWQSPIMNVFVIIMDLTGVVLIFMALPVFAFPLLEQALSTSVPTSVEDDLENHVVICSYTTRAEALIEELDSWGVAHVIVESDRDRATELYEDGHRVIYADPTSVEGLENARLGAARALVADVSDEVDASIVLAGRELTDDVQIVSVIEEPERRNYHRLAGADDVLSPRPLLGQSLASKVTTSLTTELGGAVEVAEDFEVAELLLRRGSELVGTTLAESGIREQAGVNVIGAWFQGEFETPPSPSAELTDGTVLLVAGRENQLEQLKELTLAKIRRFTSGETIVIGHGEVGSTVTAALDEESLPYTVVDRTEMEGADVVGDATEPETLRAAGIDDARSAVLAIPDDTTTEFATLVIRDVSPETEVIARVEELQSVQKMYQAGADYVLSLATVSGRMIASTILEDEDVLSLDQQVEVVRVSAPELVGQTIGDALVRSKTGCTVVGVERDGTVVTNVGPEFGIEAGDELVIAGTDDGIRRFNEQMT